MEVLTAILDKLGAEQSLIVAFAVIGAVMWISYFLSRRLTGGRIHGSAIAIVIGLILALIGGVMTGGKKGVAEAKVKLEQAKQAATGAWNQLENVIDDKVAAALNGVGVPTRDEIRSLSQRIADLTAKVEGKTARPAKPAARKTAAKKTTVKRPSR